MLLSVIVPTRNRGSFVSDLLDTLAIQVAVEFTWEVLIIDNGSTDQTFQIVQNKITSLPITIRYIYEPRLGLHNGRHRGALEGRGKYLAYLDDDVLLTPTWILGIEKLISGQADAVVGRILPKWETQPPAWLVTFVRGAESSYFSLLDMGDQGLYIEPRFVYGDNFFIPTHLVFKLGGFHPDSMPADQLRYRGDGEYALMMKFKDAGFKAWYDPKATVYHRIPKSRMSVDYLCKRAYAEGISDSYMEIREKQSTVMHQSDERINHVNSRQDIFRNYIGRIKKITFHRLFSYFINRILGLIPLSQMNIKKRLRQA